MYILLLLLSLIFGVATNPNYFYLREFSARDNHYVYDMVESGANLYLASNDDWMYLKNITIRTGAHTYTLEKLLVPNDDGSAASIPIPGNFSIVTTNNNTVTAKLSGFFYFTTALQAQDPTFHVFVVQTTRSVSVTGMKSTVVILNTLLKASLLDGDLPHRTSYVTNIKQSPNTNLYFHWDMPYDDWKSETNNTFFQNPIVLKKGTESVRMFFDHVEPLQIALEYWYFTVDGPVSMDMENKFENDDHYNATATSTTGVMISYYYFYDHFVNFQLDWSSGGVSGYFTSAFIDDRDSYLEIKLDYYDYSSSDKLYQGCNNVGVLSYEYQQAYTLSASVLQIGDGPFYIQYFNFAGDLWHTSTIGNNVTSTTPVPTTHKNGSSAVFAMEFVVLVLMVLLLS
ncbi:hypothetical protein GCK72_016025 [Caenorhabditis remanei]|uniref:CUB-like domain-containing protein n=1 Tax=Caenorhabditis remanei TaxID=31234 RepID=A0A6A5GVP9_CAERE|nr:hypothetical protein GCK72_016025 [Caenorhabditis remanei]KAF1759558.1 hypothetical protein GCK72_016025 [Caenorhabditis remanei]